MARKVATLDGRNDAGWEWGWGVNLWCLYLD